MPMARPVRSWSVLDLVMVTTTPSSTSSRSSAASATSSLRRRAPAKPTSSSARSRVPPRPGGTTLEAQVLVADWRAEYNDYRPHSALEMLTPAEFARRWRTNQPQLS